MAEHIPALVSDLEQKVGILNALYLPGGSEFRERADLAHAPRRLQSSGMGDHVPAFMMRSVRPVE